MNVSHISYNHRLGLKANPTAQQIQPVSSQPVEQKSNDDIKQVKLNYPPIAVGLINAGVWTGVGLAFDKAYKAIFKTKGSMKTSLILNGIIGAGMGTYAYIVAKRERDAETTQQTK